jgi:hypothetical protein
MFMAENLACEFHAFHYVGGNRIADPARSSSQSQEMTMKTPSRSSTFSTAEAMIAWMLNLATRLLARILNMPEPLVCTAGMFVVAQVQTIENSVGKTLCPVRLLRQFQKWLRQPAR